MIAKVIILLTAFVMTTDAACPNACSQHGTCGADDVCTCHDNWGTGLGENNGGDCSDRLCPMEIAWVDTPDGYGKFKNYATCAGRGICDYSTGECECFAGYEGKACKRQSCPEDCNGHGTCEYVDDIGYGNSYMDWSATSFKDEPKKFEVFDWDSRKSRVCKCDPGYSGPSCDKRRCPHGNDVLDYRDNLLASLKYQQQVITFESEAGTGATSNDGRTFALRFTSIIGETYTTQPIVFKTGSGPNEEFAVSIGLALSRLPGRAVEGVSVSVTHSGPKTTVTLDFKGCYNEGNMQLIEVLADECLEGCQPRITGLKLKNFWNRFEDTANTGTESANGITQTVSADYNSYECGNRGKCDYTSGECSCFPGYSGVSCNLQVNLK